MKKFEGILLCSDYDNTLRDPAQSKAPISKENAEAIRYFQENGGLFTLITGRHPYYIRKFSAGFAPNAPVAGYHGDLIAAPQGEVYLYNNGQRDKRLFDVIEGLWESDPTVTQIKCHTEKPDPYRCVRGAGSDGNFQDPAAMRRSVPLPLFNLLVAVEEGSGLRMRDLLLARIAALGLTGRLTVTRPMENGCEIIRRGCDKADALRRIKEMTGARLTVAMGDYENDVSMIRAADIGYAVANAVPALRAVADRVTVDCKEHAAAAVIADLERALIG